MDRSSRLKDIFFNNLLLLGFNKAAIEKEYRVTCDKNMFAVPNQKMFIAVTHFLFSKLKGKYILPWPLLDKDQHRQFQKLTYNYLSSISLESNVKFPRITPSLLSTISGERFYELYVAFSSHVVEQGIKRNGNVELISCPKVTPSNCKNIVETLKIETVLSTEKSQHIQKLFRRHFEELLKYANDYYLLINKLKSTLMANHSKVEERVAYLCSLYSQKSTQEATSTLKDAMEKGVEYEKRIKTHWASLEKFLMKEIELWKYLGSEVEERSEKYILDGTLIKVPVPDILMKEHSQELKALEVNSVMSEETEKPCLLRYIKVFIIALESCLESYRKGSVTNMQSHCKVENTQNLDESLNKLIHLSEKIAKDVLSNIKESTENLHKTVLVNEFSQDLEDMIKECPSWNFSSKSFNERIQSSRSSTFLPFSNEDPKLSLFSSKSSAETGCTLNESYYSENILGASYNNDLSIKCNLSTSANLESCELLKENWNSLENLNNLKEHEFKEPLETICNKDADTVNGHFLKNLLSDDIQNDCVQEANVGALAPLPDLLFNLEFDYSRPIKMRESWQLEDSLHAITFPDDVLID